MLGLILYIISKGILYTCLLYTSKLLEIKKIYQYIKFRELSLNTGKIEIENKYDFTNLNEFNICLLYTSRCV